MDDTEYKENVTQGSILYPYIALFAAIFKFEELYSLVQKLKTDHLPHCNFQVWYPEEASEENYYTNKEMHGATLSHVAIDKDHADFMDQAFKECDESNHFNELSAIKYNFWPLILLASRHHRLPIPIHFFLSFLQAPEKSKGIETNQDAE